jgi:hypothetical protein
MFIFWPIGYLNGLFFKSPIGDVMGSITKVMFYPHFHLMKKWHWYYNYYYSAFDAGLGRNGTNTIRYDQWEKYFKS